jgi:hypothetical protein
MAQGDVKDRVVHETKGTIQGYIFSCIYVQKKKFTTTTTTREREKKEVVKETPTFNRTKILNSVYRSTRYDNIKTLLKNQVTQSYQRPSKD